MKTNLNALILIASLTAGTASAQTDDPVKAHSAFSALVEQCRLTSGQYQALGVMLTALEAIMTPEQIAETREKAGKNSLYFPDRWSMGDPWDKEKTCPKAAAFAGIDGIE